MIIIDEDSGRKHCEHFFIWNNLSKIHGEIIVRMQRGSTKTNETEIKAS